MLAGKDGKSADLRLESSANDFERGRMDTFLVELPPGSVLGKLTEVDIGFAAKQGVLGTLGGLIGGGWEVEYVQVVDMETNEQTFFPLFATVTASRPRVRGVAGSPADRPPDHQAYKVLVRTSNIRNAGTDANVFITLYGKAADGSSVDSGAQRLESSRNDFERGRRDEFTITCPPLGDITRCEVTTDARGLGGDWHLQDVEVVDLVASRSFFFPCGRWLSSADPKSLTQVLVPSTDRASELVPLIEYIVTVATGDARGAGTDADVFLSIHGDKGAVTRRPLVASGNLFERGARDVFHLEAPDVGEIQSVTVEHDGKGLLPTWLLDYVEIYHPVQGRSSFFSYRNWLDKRNQCRAEIKGTQPKEGAPVKHRYRCVMHEAETLSGEVLASGTQLANAFTDLGRRVAVQTSDIRGAGTDSDVTIKLVGTKGDSGERPLVLPGRNLFERGQEDVFMLDCDDLGDVVKVVVKTDGRGLLSQWHLSHVQVVHLETGKAYRFPCKAWLDRKAGLQRELAVDADGDGKGDQGGSEGAGGHPFSVKLYTSDLRGAGTDGDVSVSLHGDKGFIGGYRLPAQRAAFERAKCDTFDLLGTDCGRLSKIEVELKPSGLLDAWHLAHVEVLDKGDGRVYVFPCNKWLNKESPRVELAEGMVAGGEAPKVLYTATVWTANKRGAGTDDKVLLEVVDDKGRMLSGAPYELRDSTNNFEQGRVDSFQIEVPADQALSNVIAKIAVEKRSPW